MSQGFPTPFAINKILPIPGPKGDPGANGSTGPAGPSQLAGQPAAGSGPQHSHVMSYNGSQWLNRADRYLNAGDYGAVGDGSADDTAALQAVIDAAGTIQGAGQTVLIPSSHLAGGFYKTSKPIIVDRTNLHIFGDSVYGSNIRTDGTWLGPGVVIASSDSVPLTSASITGTGQSLIVGLDSSRPAIAFQYIDIRDIPQAMDLMGATSLTAECTFQNDVTVDPANYGVIYAHSGAFDGLGTIISLQIMIQPGSDGNHSDLIGYLKTTVGGGTITIPDAVVKGSPIYVALDWDGTTLRLFHGAPGSTTSNSILAASGAYDMGYDEGFWLAGGLSLSWPMNQPTLRPLNGKLDSFRLSNFSRHATDYTAPAGKISTLDVDNLNVGGSGKDTIYLTNAEAYRTCWLGYTWLVGGGKSPVYHMNRQNGGPTAMVVKMGRLTVTNDLGKALELQRAIGSRFDDLELYGNDGYVHHGDSFYTQLSNVNVYSRGPLMSTARLPYPHVGFFFELCDAEVRKCTSTGAFAYHIYATGAGLWDYFSVITLGWTRVPVFINGGSSFAMPTFRYLQIDDEGVVNYPGWSSVGTTRGNALCGMYITGPNIMSMKSCTITVQSSPDVPCIIGEDLLTGSSKGILTLDGCLLVGSDCAGAASPAFTFTGTPPNVPVKISGTAYDVALTSAAQKALVSTDTGIQWSSATQGTWGAAEADMPAPTTTTSATPVAAFTYAMADLTTLEIDVIVTAKNLTTTSEAASWNLSASFLRNGSGPMALQAATDKSSRGTNSHAPPSGWDADIIVSSNSIIVQVTGPASDHVKFQVVPQEITVA